MTPEQAATIMRACGWRVYWVPNFHKNGALVRDLDSVFIREGLLPDELDRIVTACVGLYVDTAMGVDA